MIEAKFNANLRLLKLKLLSDEMELKVDRLRFEILEDNINLINKKIPDYILTGSSVLYLFKWIDRLPNDYDVIIDKKVYKKCKHKIKVPDVMYPEITHFNFDRLGIIKSCTSEIDVFLDNHKKYEVININGYKIKYENPLSILKYKSDMYSNKNNNDLFGIFQKLLKQ